VVGRHAELMQRLHEAVLGEGASLPYETRLALATGRGIPTELKPYADKVARHAYRVVDGDVAALRAAGYDDDQIFEITVAVALGVGLHRRDVALSSLDAAR
jgi:hypothetical protein